MISGNGNAHPQATIGSGQSGALHSPIHTRHYVYCGSFQGGVPHRVRIPMGSSSKRLFGHMYVTCIRVSENEVCTYIFACTHAETHLRRVAHKRSFPREKEAHNVCIAHAHKILWNLFLFTCGPVCQFRKSSWVAQKATQSFHLHAYVDEHQTSSTHAFACSYMRSKQLLNISSSAVSLRVTPCTPAAVPSVTCPCVYASK
jgi:hypothetical protein